MEGACVAMDMATAYGFLDDTKRKMVTRALTQSNNPYVTRFPSHYSTLIAGCADVAKNRWNTR